MKNMEATLLDLKRRLLNYCREGEYIGTFNVQVGANKKIDFLSYEIGDKWRAFNIRLNKTEFQSRIRTPYVADLNYYIFTGRALYNSVKKNIPAKYGILIPSGKDTLECLKKPTLITETERQYKDKALFQGLIRALGRNEEKFRKICDLTSEGWC